MGRRTGKALAVSVAVLATGVLGSCGGGGGGGSGGPVAWHVDVDAPGPTHDGTSWATAFLHPQDGVDAALSGKEVWVAEGTYTRRDSGDTVLLTMKDGVSLYGGFAGAETSREERDPVAHQTVLDGETLVYHVVVGASDATLDGFTATGGNASGAGDAGRGAGMLNDQVAGLTVANCTFSGNSARSYGGGMYNYKTSPAVVGCTFLGNTADSRGGGMYNATNSCPAVIGCTFSGNTARDYYGGGMCNSSSSPSVISCIFSGNSTSSWGGGMHNDGSSPDVTNCTFSGNAASDWGGAICNYYSYPTVTNCVLWGGSATEGPEIYDYAPSSSTVSRSNVGQVGGFTDGGGNINADPLFVDADGADDTPGTADDDLHLQAGSSCIDAANGSVAPASDIEGNARLDDPGMADIGAGDPTWVDMGAYEFQGTTAGSWVNVLAPSAGAQWKEGSDVTIRWVATADVSEVKIELSRDGGGSWETIAASAPNDRSYAWVVTGGGGALPQADCRIRISDAADQDPTGDSGAFSIVFGVWYVDGNGSGGADGLSWGTAFRHPQDAVDVAEAGDSVWIAQATYVRRNGPDTLVVAMKEGVCLYGGFAGTETLRDERDWATCVTTLDGEDACYHVVVGASDAAFDGFTVTRGYANGDSLAGEDGGAGMYNDSVANLRVANCTFFGNATDTVGGGYGGGMHNRRSSLTVTSCVFSGSTADYGGGMGNEASSPTVTDCTFASNTGASKGGGMYNEGSPAVTDCTFSGNTSVAGGGMDNSGSAATVTNCTFSGNSASSGGGMRNRLSATTVRDCTFSDNTATSGGGMYNTGSPAIADCTFSGNTASNSGGGMYNAPSSSPTVTSCTFSGNTADGGGGMYNWSSSPVVVNCTFSMNTASSGGGGMYNDYASPTVTNSILWGDSAPAAPEVRDVVSSCIVSYSDVQGGYAGTGNINADPRFADADGADDTPGTADDDLHLQAGSPCIDAGTATGAPDHDLDGNPRPSGSGYDMGAYEY